MAIILLHMFWGVVFFDACEKQRWWAVAAVVISHLVVSCLVSVGDVKDNEGGGQFTVKYKLVLLAKFCSSNQDILAVSWILAAEVCLLCIVMEPDGTSVVELKEIETYIEKTQHQCLFPDIITRFLKIHTQVAAGDERDYFL